VTAVIPAGPVHHVEDVDAVGRRWRLGALLLIFADASFVASLVFTYFYLRGLNTQGGWLPKDVHGASIWVGWVIACAVLLSALSYRFGERAGHAGDNARLVRGVGLAVVLVVLATAGQVVQLWTFPFTVSEGSYASTAYVLAAANLFHLLLTLFVGVGIYNRGRLQKITAGADWQVRIVGLWWTWITVAAVLSAFTTSFIASPNLQVGNG
jgi:heme/copper-type cytochrome/quinol oxidase subunit 3